MRDTQPNLWQSLKNGSHFLPQLILLLVCSIKCGLDDASLENELLDIFLLKAVSNRTIEATAEVSKYDASIMHLFEELQA